MSESAYRPNQYIEAGLLVRGKVRLLLARRGLEYRESKSLTRSVFSVKCTHEEWYRVRNIINSLQS